MCAVVAYVDNYVGFLVEKLHLNGTARLVHLETCILL